MIWRTSPPFLLRDRWIPAPFYLVGDVAYPLDFALMKTYSEADEDEYRKPYNAAVRRARNVVERAFGILKNRFRRLLFGIETGDVNFARHLITAAVMLHNWLQKAPYESFRVDRTILEADLTALRAMLDADVGNDDRVALEEAIRDVLAVRDHPAHFNPGRYRGPPPELLRDFEGPDRKRAYLTDLVYELAKADDG
jgi:hypothetical protein